jgi:hypothetical protein
MHSGQYGRSPPPPDQYVQRCAIASNSVTSRPHSQQRVRVGSATSPPRFALTAGSLPLRIRHRAVSTAISTKTTRPTQNMPENRDVPWLVTCRRPGAILTLRRNRHEPIVSPRRLGRSVRRCECSILCAPVARQRGRASAWRLRRRRARRTTARLVPEESAPQSGPAVSGVVSSCFRSWLDWSFRVFSVPWGAARPLSALGTRRSGSLAWTSPGARSADRRRSPHRQRP